MPVFPCGARRIRFDATTLCNSGSPREIFIAAVPGMVLFEQALPLTNKVLYYSTCTDRLSVRQELCETILNMHK